MQSVADPTRLGVDASVHLHEGLDIAAGPPNNNPAGGLVRAVMAGWIDMIYRDPADPFNSFLVIRDVQPDASGQYTFKSDGTPSDANLGTKGWNYKHVLAKEDLAQLMVPDEFGKARAGRFIAEGTELGVMAASLPLPGVTYGNHGHLDRGLAPTLNNAPTFQNLASRDATMMRTKVYDTAVKIAKLPGATALAKLYPLALRWQVAPTFNPLSEFIGVPQVVDTVKPTILSIDFRLQSDDYIVRAGDLAEREKEKSRYFSDTVTYGATPDQLRVVGRMAVARDANGTRLSKTGENTFPESRIDFVVTAYDQFGPLAQPNSQKIHPAVFKFQVKEVTLPGATGADSGWITAYEFKTFPGHGIKDFFSLLKTRAIYENDTSHSTKMDGPFSYTVTNSTKTRRVGAL